MGLVEDHLPNLLGGVLLKPSGPAYEQERQVVAKIQAGLTPAEAVGLVGYAHGLPDTPAGMKGRVAAAGEALMDNWNEGDLISRRFAACAAIQLLENNNGKPSVAAALSAEAARLTGLPSVVLQLPQIGTAALARLAEGRRAVSLAEPPLVQPFPGRGKASELPPEDATTISSTALRGYLQSQRNAVRNAATAVETRVLKLEKLAERNSEEIDLLWWTLNPYSDYLPSWNGSGDGATLVAALELSQRLLLDPPPRGTDCVLADALNKAGTAPDQQVTLDSVVQSLSAGALADPRLAGSVTAWATPVLSTLRQRREEHSATPAANGNRTAGRVRWALQLINDLSLKRVLA